MTSLSAPTRTPDALDTIRIAVVIPCYNQASFLGEAIESALTQTHGSVEIIVVDDGSPDHTAEVAAGYAGARYIRQDNQGLSAARNTGLHATDAEFALFLDSDDRLMPNALRSNLACLRGHPDTGLAYGAYRHMDECGNPLDMPRRGGDDDHSYAALLRGNIVEMHGAVLYRTATLRSVGGFDPRLDASEDYDAYLRLAAVAPIAAHDELVAEYRKYEGSMSFDARRMLAATLKVLRRQRRNARRDPEHRRAYREGIETWKDYYGRLLVSQVGNKIRTRAPLSTILRDSAASVALTPTLLARGIAAKLDQKITRPLLRRARAIKSPTRPRGMILMYHRVAELESDAWGICVSPENFGQQIAKLKQTHDVLPLREIAVTREFERPSVAITFDDGYLDNLRHALPILEEHEAPATVFVTGGPAESNDEFWWDTLERLLLQPNRLPARPELTVDGVPYRFDVGAHAEFSHDDAREFRDWRVETNRRPTARHTMFNVLYTHLASLSDGRRREELAAIAEALGVCGEPTAANRRITSEEIVELSRSRFIEIGGHTVDHPRLSQIPAEEQARQILINRDHLEGLIGKPVTSFAYPHGDYATATPDILRDLGFTVACTTRGESLSTDHGPLELPRHRTEDWNGNELEPRLDWWRRT